MTEKRTTIHDRISILVNTFTKGNNSAFARLVNASESGIRTYRNSKNNKPNYVFLERLIKTFDISAEWLMTGEGNMLKNNIDTTKIKEVRTDPKDLEIIELQRKLIKSLEEGIAKYKSL